MGWRVLPTLLALEPSRSKSSSFKLAQETPPEMEEKENIKPNSPTSVSTLSGSGSVQVSSSSPWIWGRRFLLTERSFLPCFQKINFCSLQPCLSQLSTHIHFVSRLSWLQQHSGIFGHFWSHILHHKAGVSLRAAGDLHPCLRQLHLLPLEMNSGKTRHFANYEICVK